MMMKTYSYFLVCLSLVSKAVASTGAAIEACQRLESLLAGNSSSNIPSYLDSDYSLYAQRVDFSYYPECKLNASCIVSPNDADQLGSILTVIRETGTQFSIRSGGHNYNQNWGSIDSGVLIDMVKFNSLILKEDKQTVRIGTAKPWGESYKALEGTGVALNGGRHPLPAAGVTLGAGIGQFVQREGISAKNLASVEIMLSNSTLVTASETSNPDLFWALKGGGNNFGVVTYLTYHTIPIENLWFEFRMYASEQNGALLDALYKHQVETIDNKDIYLSNLFLDLEKPGTYLGFISYDAEPYPEAFNQFYEIPYTSKMVEGTIGSQYQLALAVSGGGAATRTTAHTIDFKLTTPEIYKVALEALQDATTQLAAINGTASLVSQHFTPHMVDVSTERGGNPLGLESVLQNWLLPSISWPNAADDDEGYRLMAEMAQTIQSSVDSYDAGLSYIFANDASSTQDVIGSYGEENRQKLVAVSQAYDEGQLFQRQLKGGWRL